MAKSKESLWKRLQFWKRNRLLLRDAKSGAQIRNAILAYLGLHRKWYARWSTVYSIAWNSFTFLVVVLGAAASILTAVRESQPDEISVLWPILLPAASSFCGAILIQFRLREACRIRDHGRIAVERLIARAHLIPVDDRDKALKIAVRLRTAAHDLEEEQLVQFTSEAPAPRHDPAHDG